MTILNLKHLVSIQPRISYGKSAVPFYLSLMLSLILIVSALTGKASAQVIIDDQFSGPIGTGLSGATPDTTYVPGTSWAESFSAFGPTYSGSNSAQSGAYSSTYIGVGVLPKNIDLSAGLVLNTIGADGQNHRGLGLGFYSNAPQGNAFLTGFYGLLVSSSGVIQVVDAGNILAQTYTIQGFSGATKYNLGLAVNTTSGAVTDVSLNGSSIASSLSLASISDFTKSNLNYAGFYGSSPSGSDFGLISNFELVTIPEPSTTVLLSMALGVFALMLVVRGGHSKRVVGFKTVA